MFKNTYLVRPMTIIEASGQINIHADPKTVFDYLANLENDRFWRKEINQTTMHEPPRLGALAREDSFLSKRVPSNVLILECTALEAGRQVVYQTQPNAAFFLKSTRTVTPVSATECTVQYHIAFDKGIVKHGLGFSLPKFLVDFVTQKDMKRYLGELKRVLEGKG